MSTSLAWLVDRLTRRVPADAAGVPSAAQYQDCCEDAVADLSRRKPLQKLATLSVVSGTATYALASDFLRLASLESLGTVGTNVLVTSAGLVDFGNGIAEIYTVHGQSITFSPTPTYTASRRYWYAAAHTLDATDAYPDLTTEDARLALLKAEALVYATQAAQLSQTAYSFTIGSWSEDHGGQLQRVQGLAQERTQQYEAALKQALGPAGARGRGDIWTGTLSWEEA